MVMMGLVKEASVYGAEGNIKTCNSVRETSMSEVGGNLEMNKSVKEASPTKADCQVGMVKLVRKTSVIKAEGDVGLFQLVKELTVTEAEIKTFQDVNGGGYRVGVEKLLQGRKYGLFSSYLERIYQKIYKVNLPPNWCQQLEQDGVLAVDSSVPGKLVVRLSDSANHDSVTTSTHPGIDTSIPTTENVTVEMNDVEEVQVSHEDMLLSCKEGVRQLLEGRPYGLFVPQLERMYQKLLKDSLPLNWSQQLEEAGVLSLQFPYPGQVLVKLVKNHNMASD